MTTWKDGGDYGRLYREITNEDNSLAICRVRVRQVAYHDRSYKTPRPYPQGEANFRLILNTPELLAALEMIRKAPTYEEYSESGEETYYSLYLTDSQLTQLNAAIAAAKGENDEKANLG